MEKFFKKNDLNNQFFENGFVLVNLPDQSQIQNTIDQIEYNLKIKIESLDGHQNKNSGVSFHSTFLDSNKDYKKSVNQFLTPLFKSVIEEFLYNYRIIQLNIFNKRPHSGFVSPHQNLTTVDEEVYTSLSIWIPLQDTDEENGCLYFSPSSNKKFEKYRNPYIYWPPLKTSSSLNDYKMTPVAVKYGQALIFDDSIVHASPDNFSEKSRLSFHCIAIPKSSKPVYPKIVDSDTVELIEVNEDFWFYYTPGEKEPKGPVVKKDIYSEKIYSKDDLFNY